MPRVPDNIVRGIIGLILIIPDPNPRVIVTEDRHLVFAQRHSGFELSPNCLNIPLGRTISDRENDIIFSGKLVFLSTTNYSHYYSIKSQNGCPLKYRP